MSRPSKILVSGTGRAGTTFLMLLFTHLGLDTGWNSTNYQSGIASNCNSGLERPHTSPHKILKNPAFMETIETIVKQITIEWMILPIRKYSESAASRASFGRGPPGGLWTVNSEKEQIDMYHRIMANYLYVMVKYDIPTIFLDFDRMISDEQYLYDHLKPMLGAISFDTFHIAYTLADKHQKMRSKRKTEMP